ncbi:MAG: N-acetylmuramic acid 6-phosphate etherase [bacterium]|nr:N-acetylmuramic acid 6-phosphate etherase [bacterium]
MNKTKSTETRSDGMPLLDELDTLEILHVMNGLDAQVPQKIGEVLEDINLAVSLVADSLRNGGRLIYVGAGTSGRLAVADAAETGPTFGTDSVSAVMAGGMQAIVRPSEDCEDNRQAGADEISAREVCDKDTVIGVTANGSTPFVRGALEQAGAAGASTILISSNPAPDFQGDCLIVVDTGPEIVRGSTRLKAGTAAKLVLNMISTVSMIKVGRVVANEMVFMRPSNKKLFLRAVNILSQVLQVDGLVAEKLLEEADNSPAAAIVMHIQGLDRDQAMAAVKDDPLVVRRALLKGKG